MKHYIITLFGFGKRSDNEPLNYGEHTSTINSTKWKQIIIVERALNTQKALVSSDYRVWSVPGVGWQNLIEHALGYRHC